MSIANLEKRLSVELKRKGVGYSDDRQSLTCQKEELQSSGLPVIEVVLEALHHNASLGYRARVPNRTSI